MDEYPQEDYMLSTEKRDRSPSQYQDMSQSRSMDRPSYQDRGEPSTLKKKKTVAIHEMEMNNDMNSSPEMEEDYGEEDMGQTEQMEEEEEDMGEEEYGSTFEKQQNAHPYPKQVPARHNEGIEDRLEQIKNNIKN